MTCRREWIYSGVAGRYRDFSRRGPGPGGVAADDADPGDLGGRMAFQPVCTAPAFSRVWYTETAVANSASLLLFTELLVARAMIRPELGK